MRRAEVKHEQSIEKHRCPASVCSSEVLERMHAEHIRVGKKRLFEALQEFLWGPDPLLSTAAVAENLGRSRGRCEHTRQDQRYVPVVLEK